MNVLFVIAESCPFIKIGGLGEIGGSLPKFLNKTNKAQVRVIMPKYSSISEAQRKEMKHVIDFQVDLGWRKLYCGIEELEVEGVHYYFIDNEYYFNRDSIYGFDDDGERFAYFCKGVLEGIPYLDFKPDIIHCNDWHTSLIPLFLKEDYRNNPYYYDMKSVLTIHNLKHQGMVPYKYYEDVLGFSDNLYAWEKLEFYDVLNYLKAGVLSADRVTTVSPTYSEEIQNHFYGEALDDILRLRSHDLIGILNGIDLQKYNPETDPMIYVNYRSSLSKKAENKCRLQEFLNLPINKDIPMMCVVSRMVEQKGLDLLVHILDELLEMDIQLVMLGTGHLNYEEIFQDYARRNPEKMSVHSYFVEDLAHKIYASSDILLMPSQFEPCGLTQMMAMNYGTLPIVRETGGLKDTVNPYNEYTGEGNGFSFANYNAHEFLFTIQKALKMYNEDKDTWKKLVNSALKSNFSWEKSVSNYLELYTSLIK